jgi:RimJ/RimL family protein N-acetyltransferase
MNILGLKRLVAVTDQDNFGSIRVLEKIGLGYERLVRLSEGGPELKLFSVNS